VLVYEPSANHLVRRSWDGPAATFDSIFPIIQWLNTFTGEKGKLDMGGSVSTTAFDFALMCGADPVILAGQDLSFSHNRTHAADSLAEYYFLKMNCRTRTTETLSNKFSASKADLKLKSNSGEQVSTDRRLLLFYWWFDKKCSDLNGVKVYNTARHGAAIKGAEFVDSEELAQRITKEFRPVKKETGSPSKGTPVDEGLLARESKAMAGSLAPVLKKIDQACGLADDLYRKVRTGNQDLGRIIKELDSIDQYLESRKAENFFIQATMQRIILNITEGYEDFLNDEERENKNLGTARKSVLLYGELKKSVEYNIRLFNELTGQMEKNIP
jgi:hypothetical protein